MSDKKDKQQYSAKNVRSMKVAIFCIAALLIFYLGASFLKGMNVLSRKTYYYAVLEDIGALHESTTITLNGYPIGKVSGLKMLSTNPVRICAELMITEKIDIPKDSRFEIAQKDVLGGMVVNVIPGSSGTLARNGDTLAARLAPGLFDGIGDLKGQLASVIASVDTIGLALKSAFQPGDPENGATTLKNTLSNLEESTQHLNKLLASNEPKVGEIVTKLNRFTTTLDNVSPQLNTIIDNLDHISDSVAQSNIKALFTDAQQAVSNINKVTSNLENGKGSVGQLMQNDSLYQNINKAAESLDILIKDLKANPSRYINVSVFGKKNK
ncbi:MAG: MlaD family protein [Bacteroidales bacterium]|nr:MlaD family protein [Bacteroidales bacterium]